MTQPLEKRVSALLDHVQRGEYDPDEIGNVIRDLTRALRMKLDRRNEYENTNKSKTNKGENDK